MKNIIKVIVCTVAAFAFTAAIILYQRDIIGEYAEASKQMDIFITILCFGIILALDAFVVADCIYLAFQFEKKDPLTGIYNLKWITDFGGKMSYFGKLQGRYTMTFLNIKDCKYINEKIGNKNGDMVIRGFAQQIAKFMKKKGYIGRVGGDNFLSLIKNEYLDEYKAFLQNIYVDTVDKNNNHIKLHVEVRAGICGAIEGVEYRELINRCSNALARARNGVEKIVEYDQRLMEEFIQNRKVADQFRRALNEGEFVPFFQPKVDIDSHRLCGGEALARWVRDGKLVPPGQFIPTLEKEGSIVELDYYMFEQVCKQQREWLDSGIEPVCISINFSKLHLDNVEFANDIIAIKDKYNLDGGLLEVELTESTGCEDYDKLEKFARKIKAAGFRISIDDFGTGYSSLSMLQKFDANAVKLDKSFLDSAISDNAGEKQKRFLYDIIRMIKYQGEETVCEGVETEVQVEFVKNAGCDTIQGYYFDRPLPKNDFENRLKDKEYKKRV